jgi:glyceraldehyde 3-phosphate dehydrogenase
MLRVGINGFGRIGRAVFRINEQRRQCHIVAINDVDPDVENHAYLLKYDTTYGRFDGEVRVAGDRQSLAVGGLPIRFYAVPDIGQVPWAAHDIDIVVEATGVLANVTTARALVAAGLVAKVIVTHAPREGVDHTVVFGVNEESYQAGLHHIVSTSICDANAVGPVLRLLDDAYGVEHGYITTLHPWLSYQNLLDGSVRSVSSPTHSWSDFALGRASGASLIPKSTTLIQALGQVLPDLAQRLSAISFRVPTAIVSASDVTVTLRREVSAGELNAFLRTAAGRPRSVIGYGEEPLVSIDFKGVEQSVCVDGRWTRSHRGNSVKLVLWYDNEWGYSQRVVDTIGLIGEAVDHLAARVPTGAIAGHVGAIGGTA